MLGKEPEMLGVIPNIRNLKGHPNEVRWGWLQYSPVSARAHTMPKLFLKSKRGASSCWPERHPDYNSNSVCPGAFTLCTTMWLCIHTHTQSHTHTITQPSRINFESGYSSFQSKENKRHWARGQNFYSSLSIAQTCCFGSEFSMNRKGK